MNPLTKEQFQKLWKEKSHGKPLPAFKVVKAFSHPEDISKPITERRSCVGIFPDEFERPTPKIYFQIVNNEGKVWMENPHLYMLSLERFRILKKMKHAFPSPSRHGKWEVVVDRCTIAMNFAQLEDFLDERQIFEDVQLVNGLAAELRMELRRFQMAVEGIIRKYEV